MAWGDAAGPFGAASFIVVTDLVPEDGIKLAILRETRRRAKPGGPAILVDRCTDRSVADFERRLARYVYHARRSGVDLDTVVALEPLSGRS